MPAILNNNNNQISTHNNNNNNNKNSSSSNKNKKKNNMSCSTPCHKIHPQPTDHFDSLPDSIILLIFNLIADVKHLGRCSVVSKRFHSLIPQVENVTIHVDCVISDDNMPPPTKSRHPISSFFRLFMSKIFPTTSIRCDVQNNCVTHHSPSHVLKNFKDIKRLLIELPSGELGLDSHVMLKWKATFGSTLDTCVILGASSSVDPNNNNNNVCRSSSETTYINNNNNTDDNTNNNMDNDDNNDNNMDSGSIPESFYTNGGLKLRVVWTISSLIAASARHYMLQGIIKEHETLEELVLTDTERQGVLCMDKEQLEELRVKPLSASLESKRTLVPALNMRLWYAPELVLGNGIVLKGATLVAIRPSEGGKKEVGGWVGDAFEEPFRSAVRMLVKRRTYCLEMNSF